MVRRSFENVASHAVHLDADMDPPGGLNRPSSAKRVSERRAQVVDELMISAVRTSASRVKSGDGRGAGATCGLFQADLFQN